jgi:hypothetical protein
MSRRKEGRKDKPRRGLGCTFQAVWEERNAGATVKK